MLRDFLGSTLLRCDLGSVYVCTLPNEKGSGQAERHVLTTDVSIVEGFAARQDQAGRGLFFCVSAIQDGKSRRKENYAQSAMLHADVDFKGLTCTAEEALQVVRNLPLRPTWIIHSGNGLHAYWVLKELTSDRDRVEATLKKLCYAVSGDPLVAHSVALMRLPGSHNTKGGKWTLVSGELTAANYRIEEVEEWLESAQPTIRKVGEEDNPFLRAARTFGYKPPIDADTMLGEMVDGNIHDTQLRVTASLLSSGMEVDEVVTKVMKATAKVAGTAWDMTREERAVRGMCDDWLKKHPRAETATVVNLATKRAEKTPKKNLHLVVGAGVLGAIAAGGRQLITTTDGVWLYDDGLWQVLHGDEWKQWVNRLTEECCEALKVVATIKLRSEVRAWIECRPHLFQESVAWDDHGKIATRSGLVDFKTLEVEPLRPDHWASHWIDAEFDREAKCPQWQQLLDDADLDRATQSILQEVLGAGLLDKKPRGLMRALVLVGGSNSGKSTILRVMAKLLSDKPITTALDTLENAHGLQDFLRRAPWLLDEAFDQSKWHMSAATKALLSGDYVGVNVKNGPMVSHIYRSAVFWGTNVPPQFKEISRAMENRLLIIKCKATFDPAQPQGIARVALTKGYASPADLILAEEKSGVLSWALAGLRRAWDRGYIEMTPEVRENLREMRLEANMAAGFFEECVEFNSNTMVSRPDLYTAFSAWWTENSDRTVPSPKSFGKAVAGLGDSRIVSGDLRFKKIWQLAGIELNEVGLDYWQAQFNAIGARGGSSDRISASQREVNTPIPDTWDRNARIRHMRDASDV